MRKNNIRRWLHCALDFLPLFLIPVFMIYSHRHEVTERTEVEVQYKYQTNDYYDTDDLVLGNLYKGTDFYFSEDYHCDFRVTIVKAVNLSVTPPYGYTTDDWDVAYDFTGFDKIDIEYSDGIYAFRVYDGNTFVTYVSDTDSFLGFFADEMYFYVSYNLDDFITYLNHESSLLTQISKSDYNVIESVNIEDTKSDIMSVFTNDFYNATHKYFNMDSVINLGQVYHWFETNLFGGNVPIGIHAVWHIISYEFVMDIIFLVYSVFMFIIDFTEKFLSSMYDKSFGGGR